MSTFIPRKYRSGIGLCRNQTTAKILNTFLRRSVALTGISSNLWRSDYYFMPPCTTFKYHIDIISETNGWVEKYITVVYVESTHCFCRKKRDDLYFTSEMVKRTDRTEQLQILFSSQMVVSEQVWSYGFMDFIAETGGIVGLFLGWSLLQMKEIIILCLNHRYLKY